MVSETTERKLNILIVADEIYPYGHGGVHTYVYELAKGLKCLGHNVYVLIKGESNKAIDTSILEGFNVYKYKVKRYHFKFLYQISSILSVSKAFKRMSRSCKFNLINLHSPYVSFGLNMSKAAKKIPKVYTFHALLAEEESSDGTCVVYKWYHWRKYVKFIWFPIYLLFSRWLEKRALNDSDKIITLSEFTADCLKKIHSIPTEKMVIIPAGVDTEKFKLPVDKGAVRKMLNLPKDELILFTVRRLVPRMGLGNLIEAMPVILKKFPNTILVIGGEGPLYLQLKSLIDTSGLKEKILLIGLIPDEKLPFYYQASDLFILPSKTLEGFGIVTLEALASGVPVLATPVGGSTEILTKLDRNLIFKDITSASMAELIAKYLTDNKRRASIQAVCRQFVIDNYARSGFAQNAMRIFLEVARANGEKL
ncbi:MAG: glycosyltransferase family 4 protein [Candidatus Omnitrophica bacterium]|nr:glycosyltransferase family 4 protein [Candidatus Omnitrophota bacterium]MDD5429314.1 glycosyltransferase family 4 protein [Candidatus Omnitrophota bacterium]